jgi:flagellar motility protein MotE (MotC chaperone)
MGEPIRILRVLMVSALILLGVKTIDIVTGNDALAEEHGASTAPPAEAKAPVLAPEAKTPAPDSAGTAKPDAAKAPAPPADMSRSEMDVLQNLGARRQELEERARELDMRENLLRASEQRVDERISELKGIEKNIQALLQQRDQAQEAQLTSLVKVYENMKPGDAARIFDKLDMTILLPVAQKMKPPKIALVLAAMDSDAAKRLTVNLATHLSATQEPIDGVNAPPQPAAPANGG